MSRGTVAILVGPDCEDLEVWYPKLRLEEAGYHTPLVGMGDATYRRKWGYLAVMDLAVADVDPASVVGVLAPGGWAPTSCGAIRRRSRWCARSMPLKVSSRRFVTGRGF